MKMKRMALGMIAAVAAVACTVGFAGGAWAVKCPTGFPRQGQEVSSLAQCSVEDDGNDLMTTVQTILNVIVGVVGIAAVAVIILGGVTFVTSQGDAAKVTKGKNTIIYGVVGLIVALLAFAIVNFVLSAVFGSTKSGGGGGGNDDDEESIVQLMTDEDLKQLPYMDQI